MAFLKELLKHSHNNNLTANLIGMNNVLFSCERHENEKDASMMADSYLLCKLRKTALCYVTRDTPIVFNVNVPFSCEHLHLVNILSESETLIIKDK